MKRDYCFDCGLHWTCYMLEKRVWAQIAPREGYRGGFLCLSCAGNRLGRSLEPADFAKGIDLNDGYFYAVGG